MSPTPPLVGAAAISRGKVRLTHRPLSSSFLGLPYRILGINPKKELPFYGLYLGFYKVIPKKELLRGLWVEHLGLAQYLEQCEAPSSSGRGWSRGRQSKEQVYPFVDEMTEP